MQKAAVVLYDVAESFKYDADAADELQSCLIRYCRENDLDLQKVQHVARNRANEWPGGAYCQRCGCEVEEGGLCRCHREESRDSNFTLGLGGSR